MSERSVQADVVKKASLKYKVSKLRGTTGSNVQGVSKKKASIRSHLPHQLAAELKVFWDLHFRCGLQLILAKFTGRSRPNNRWLKTFTTAWAGGLWLIICRVRDEQTKPPAFFVVS